MIHMNKKYLKENNLYEAHKQFMRLCEWSYVPTSLEEDDAQEDPNAAGAPPMDNPNGGAPMDGAPADDSMGAPVDGGMGAPGLDDGGMGAPGLDDGGMGAPGPDDGGMGAPGPDSDVPMGDEPDGGIAPDMDNEDSPEDDEEVIDVDDITNAQEKVNDKVNSVGKNLGKVDDKITSLLNSLDKMQQMIDNNNQEIEVLKQEFSKRNPTPTEKLNLRSLDSYPFNVRPDEYWRDKAETSNYQGYSDNEEPTTDEYKITNDDVDNFDDRDMENSFFIDDDMQQDLKKIFGL